MFTAYLIASLAVAAVLGLIPAYIAREKGRSFGLWWFYGWMLFVVALIHALCLQGPTDPAVRPSSVPYTPTTFRSAEEELEQYRRQRDAGQITEEKYRDIERQILGVGSGGHCSKLS